MNKSEFLSCTMFQYYLTLLLIVLVGIANGHALEATDETVISLLTVSPGQESYTAHGHSAIRVKDDQRNFDWVFNYGTFDFNTEGFTMKFMRGKLPYFLSVESYRNFEFVYDYDQRSIFEQELNLSLQQKQVFLDFLANNAKPENKYYLYDFLYDNCSSRIRDIVESEFESEQFVSISSEKHSFRQLIDANLKQGEWCDLGIDLLLGSPIDKTASDRHRMFLPYELMYAFDHATVDGKALVSKKETILEHGERNYTEHFWLKPAAFFWLVLLIFLVTFVYVPRKVSKVLALFVLFILGSAGAFLLFMWFGTDHLGTKWNLNVIWANPIYVVVFALAIIYPSKNITNTLLSGTRGLLILFLITWPINPQEFHIAVLPLTFLATLCLSVVKQPMHQLINKP